MALSANANYPTKGLGWIGGGTATVANGVTVYHDAALAMIGPAAGDSTVGQVKPYTGADDEIFVGFAVVTGTDTVTGDGTSAVTVEYSSAPRVAKVAVTGVSSAQQIGEPVYASDDGTFTLTKPTRGKAMGVVRGWYSSTTADVLFFGQALMGLLSEVIAPQTIHVAHIDLDSVADGNVITALPFGRAGKILSTFAVVDIATTGGGSGTVSLNWEIDGTNVTGGVITIAEAVAKGTVVQGTAITAANVVNQDSTIDLEAASVTDLTAGSCNLYIVFQPALGL